MLHYSTIDSLFQSPADPTRRDIVEALGTGERRVSDLSGRYDMTVPAVGQHLRVPEGGGLVTTRKVGRERICALAPEGVAILDRWVAERRAQLHAPLANLAAHLGE